MLSEADSGPRAAEGSADRPRRAERKPAFRRVLPVVEGVTLLLALAAPIVLGGRTDLITLLTNVLILSLLETRPRHGYDLSKLIHARSGGTLRFHIDSLYPLLYRLEERAWIRGTWVEKPGERRRRYYKVTAEGRRVLAKQRKTWDAFVEAVRRVTGGEHA